jgi:hypothetical protein
LKGSEIVSTEAVKLELIDELVNTLTEAVASNRKFQLPKPGGSKMEYAELQAAFEAEQTKNAELQAQLAKVQAEQAETFAASLAAPLTAQLEVLTLLETAETLRIPAMKAAGMLKEQLEAGFTIAQAETVLKQVAKNSSPAIDASGGLAHSRFKPEGNTSEKVSTLKESYKTATGR